MVLGALEVNGKIEIAWVGHNSTVPSSVYPSSIEYGCGLILKVDSNNRFLGIAGGREGKFALGWGTALDEVTWKLI